MKKSNPSRAKTVESKIQRITKISISKEIARQIMDLISNGDLKPGDLIFEAIERNDADAARKAMHAHLEGHLLRYTDSAESVNAQLTRPVEIPRRSQV